MDKKESETLEFKKSTSELKEAIISVVSILNKYGKGEIYFGIKNNGEIIGQRVGERTIRDISKSISDHIEPKIFPKISEIILENKKCIHIEFSGKDKPYYAYGRVYIRVGDEDKKLSSKELEKMILEKNKDKLRWDKEICKGATLDDIDDVLISRFIELAKKSKRINIKNEGKELILKKLNLISDSKITNAGIILFGKNPSVFFDNNLVKCGRFKGVIKEEFIDMKDFNGNLFDNLDNAISFFKEHLRITAKIKGLLREEKWEIPIEALREAIINALIHRNYFDNSFVYIKIYDSKIVIANPGKLHESLKIADLYKEHESKLRNPLLAKVLYYAGFIDVWGRGSLNIIEELASEGLDKPVFEQGGGSFRVIFKRSEGVNVGVNVGVNALFDYIEMNPGKRVIHFEKDFDVTSRTIERWLTQLKKEGKIEFKGSSKTGGYWKIVKNDKNRGKGAE